MSYRLVNANELAIKYPEVNDMPCIYADLPNGLDNGYYDLSSRRKGQWQQDLDGTYLCSECGSGFEEQPTLMGNPMFVYCPICGAEMKEGAE